MNSVRVNTMIDEATHLARAYDSARLEVCHLTHAAAKMDIVKAALESVIDYDAFMKDVDKECATCRKETPERLDAFRMRGIQRRINYSIDAQKTLAYAAQLAAAEDGWNTGAVEISHVIMALTSLVTSKAVNAHLLEPRASKENMVKVVNAIVEHEYNEYAMQGKKLRKPNMNVRKATNNGKEFKNDFCRDLVAASEKDDKPFVGRTNEVAALIQCLERRDKPNAILAGAPGVGKTDIVRGLAKKIANDEVPAQLIGASLFSVDIPGMLSGSEFRGSFEKRLKELLDGASELDRPILFIDEIHMVLGAGKTMDSSMDAANILKPYLTEGKIRVIGATTDDEFRKYVEKDSAFMRRFQKIDVSEPSPADTVKILEGVKPAYESFHGLKINKDAIKTAVDLSVRHMHDRFLPDKAIDIIDQTCARVKIEAGKKVTVTDIETTVADICHVPTATVKNDEMSKVRNLEKNLKSKVFGQEEAIETIVEAVQMSKAGLGDETQPIGSFMFVGPSGVGKTEIAKQLAANLGIGFIRFDMSEYAEAHSIAKLVGAPAGYVGYDDGGLLVEQVRKQPNSVVLFDEIEKAHPEIYKIFLQIFDYGMLTDSKGRKADFRNTVIIMTSNAGNNQIEKASVGFVSKGNADKKATSMNAVKNLMAPELRGRLTATVVFNHLSNDVAKMVVQKELAIFGTKLKVKGVTVTYTDAAIDEIVKRGVSDSYGARAIKRVIDSDIKKLFVKYLVEDNYAKSYTVDFADDKFVAQVNLPTKKETVVAKC